MTLGSIHRRCFAHYGEMFTTHFFESYHSFGRGIVKSMNIAASNSINEDEIENNIPII